MVSTTPQDVDCSTVNPTSERYCFAIQERSSPPAQKAAADGMSCFRSSFNRRGLPPNVTELLIASWREGTKAQYSCYIKRWMDFCDRKQCDPYSQNEIVILEFLTDLFEKGLGYSAINTARSALSSLLDCSNGCSAGKLPLVKRLLKGIFQIRPSNPRYNCTWDVKLVLNYLESLSPLAEINFKYLTLKLTMLMVLLSAQRAQTLANLRFKLFVFE